MPHSTVPAVSVDVGTNNNRPSQSMFNVDHFPTRDVHSLPDLEIDTSC